MNTGLILSAVGVWLVSYLLTGAVRFLAIRRGVLDTPNPRSSHTVPTPRGGGLAILAASIPALGLGVAAGWVEGPHALVWSGGMGILGAIGWLDDARGVSPSVRLAAHVTVAAAAVYLLGGLPSISLGHGHAIRLGWAGYFVAVLGVVWSVNLFNFMDGIDGLAGSQAVLVFGVESAVLAARGDHSLAIVAGSIAVASAGFLAWNWPPAKIFLGDVGSGSLGYAVGILAVAAENRGSAPLLAFVIIAGVFVFDATVTLVRRRLRGHRFAEAHREHAYQRLSRALGSHRSVTTRAAALTALLAVIGAAAAISAASLLVLLALVVILLLSLWWAVERIAPM